MATASHESVVVVPAVAEVREDRYTLELNEREFKFLALLVGSCGGTASEAYRIYDAIHTVSREAFGEAHDLFRIDGSPRINKK